MDESDSGSHQESSSDDTEIALESEKDEIDDQSSEHTPDTTGTNSSKPSKQYNGQSYSNKQHSLRKAHSNPNLVLQMYSHIKNQRKLEQEKATVIARAERKRQKLKINSFKETFSDISSLNRFGGYWTHCRLARPHNVGLDETGDSVSIGYANSVVSNSLSTVRQNQRSGEAIERNTRRIEIPSASDAPRGRSQNQTHQETRRFVSETASSSPYTTKHKPIHSIVSNNKKEEKKSSFIEHNHNPGNNSPRANNFINNKAAHVLKGPGKVHIQFSRMPGERSIPAHPALTRQQSYEWGSMPAGVLTSTKPKWMTINSKIM